MEAIIQSKEEWEKLTKSTYLDHLCFESENIRERVQKKLKKLYQKGELSRQQIWFGHYFSQEILHPKTPDVIIRYINPTLGWGVFANRNFAKTEFIASYTGIVRKYRRKDHQNAYCFEYTLANGIKTAYTIDAQDQGNISRLINHSVEPNLISNLATIDFINYVILITNQPIAKGTQLSYDYGPTYWSKREAPQQLFIDK